jgi:hypothetical protein
VVYNPSSGQIIIWNMVDSELASSNWVTGAAASAATGWEIRGTGDFDRDGYTDILWWHPASGYLSVWLMNGNAVRATPLISQRQWQFPGWDLKGTGDFNQDGYPDLLWHNQTTGEVAVWLLRGMTFTRQVTLPWNIPGPSWNIVSR